MLKKFILLALLCLLAHTTLAQTLSMRNAVGKEQPSADEVKKRVESFGVGITARVSVRLLDGAKMRGFIDRAGPDHFYLVRTDEQIGTAAVIAYAEVARIEGHRSTVDWRNIAYRSGMGAGVVLSFLRTLHIQGPISSRESLSGH